MIKQRLRAIAQLKTIHREFLAQLDALFALAAYGFQAITDRQT